MDMILEMNGSVRESIEAWEKEGRSESPSEEFFFAMVGFMRTFLLDSLPSTADAFVNTGLCSSKGDFKRLSTGKGLTVNNRMPENTLKPLFGKFVLLGKGKSDRILLVLSASSK